MKTTKCIAISEKEGGHAERTRFAWAPRLSNFSDRPTIEHQTFTVDAGIPPAPGGPVFFGKPTRCSSSTTFDDGLTGSRAKPSAGFAD